MFPSILTSWNWAQTKLRILEEQVKQNSFHVDHFNVMHLPLKDPFVKASRILRDPAELDQLVVHVTAVKGGFGTSTRRRRYWEGVLGDDLDSLRSTGFPAIDMQLTQAGVWRPREDTEGRFVFLDEDFPRLCQRLALWERFRGIAYHQVATRAGDVLATRPLSMRTYHGNGGNDGAGYALDMHPTETPDEDFMLTARHGLHMLADRMAVHRRGLPPIVVKVTSHRQHKYPGRANDPGVWAAQNVVVPVVRERDDLVIAHGLTTGSGRPWPNTWDRNSPYDTKNRRIDGR